MGHSVDIYVGMRVKERRVLCGFSQEDLGKALKITFQQVQKYEKGLNRISCSRLYEIAVILNVPISYFFDGFENQHKKHLAFAEEDADSIYLSADEERNQLVELYFAILNTKLRRQLLNLIALLGGDFSKISK